jgi:hypothetical protein
MTTENRPHVVFCPAPANECGLAFVMPTYEAAHKIWLANHTPFNPWLIATLGRVIDPATPIIDVNE